MKKYRKTTSIAAVNYKKKNHANYFDYEYTDGTVIRIIAGEDGVTQDDIDELIRDFNRQVDHNCYHDKPQRSKEYKEQQERYEEVHYDNTVGKGWTLSYDAVVEASDDGCNIDELGIMFTAWNNTYTEVSDRVLDLRAAIEDLSEEEKQIIYLYFYEGMTYRAIGDILGVSKDTVVNRLRRILNTLKNEIE